ncbi:MAG: V-type ATPase subunit [Candidatus Methanospirareceae archaeon]
MEPAIILVIAVGIFALMACRYLLRIAPLVYATAVIRAKEARLMDEKDFEELILSPFEDFSSVLESTEYGEYVCGTGYEEIERGLLLYKRDLHGEIFGLIPQRFKGVFDFLIREWDVANLRTVLVGIHAGMPEEEIRKRLVDAGYIFDLIKGLPGKELEEVAFALEGTPYNIRVEIEEYKATGDFSSLEIALEKMLLERMLEKAEGKKKELITFKQYLQVLIESLDLKAMLRGKAGGGGAEEIRRFLMEFEVEMDYEDSEDVKVLLERLRETRYSYLIEDVREELDLMEMEKRIDEAVLRKGKEISTSETFGLGPIIGFLVMKEAEIRNIRLIAKLKEEGLGPEKIKELLVCL